MSSPSIPTAVSVPPPPPAPHGPEAPPLQDDVTRLLPISTASRASVRILIVDDERTLRESCVTLLRSQGYTAAACGRGDEALQTLKSSPFDIVLIDLYMSQVPGLALLRAALDVRPDMLVVMMTGNPSVDSSIEVLRAGAWDYLPKPFSATHLQVLVGRAAHTVLVARETRALQGRLEQEHGNSEKVTVLGSAPAFRRAIELARRVASTDASVFITGESGAGKEQIAQFIHHHSRRSSRPLVAINCAALPEALLESEMFGHVKGAFTGAVRDKPGLLEMANGGTLFLDELIEMSKPIQAKLLRVIQDGVVRRVGSETTDAIVNVRFIAATNQVPEDAVKSTALREDLYYRLRVVPIHVPALRERPDDIPLLATHFLAYYWNRHRSGMPALPKLTEAALTALRAHSWPGNVRELQNVIEHAVVLLEPSADVRPEDIPFITGNGQRAAPAAAPGALIGSPTGEKYYASRDRMLAEFDRQYLIRLVQLAGGNMSKAARLAGIDRTTLYRLMERQGMQRDPEGLALTEDT